MAPGREVDPVGDLLSCGSATVGTNRYGQNERYGRAIFDPTLSGSLARSDRLLTRTQGEGRNVRAEEALEGSFLVITLIGGDGRALTARGPQGAFFFAGRAVSQRLKRCRRAFYVISHAQGV